MIGRVSNKGANFLNWGLSFCLVFALQLHAQDRPCNADVVRADPVSDPPETRSPVILKAINDPETGKAAFSYRGQEDPPVIRAKPGQHIRVTYVNEMSTHSHEHCVDGPCTNMTNLHFHGLHVSPNAPQDDAITMMAMPGQSLEYVVTIPRNQSPGLYWYHTHPHGESYQQALDGMSGAIVIDGIENYVPQVRDMRERILVIRDAVIEKDDAAAKELRQRVQIPAVGCSASTEKPERILTVNGAVRPQIAIAPGERQFWRIVNASPDLYADLQMDTEPLEVVALDGMPLALHDPQRRTETVDHILIPPAGRVEAIVHGPKAGVRASLRTRCFDTGSDGDPNPAMVLADLTAGAQSVFRSSTRRVDTLSAINRPISPTLLKTTEDSSPEFVVTFTEDKKGFYINGKKYGPTDPPMTTVAVGKYQHWRVVNDTQEVHPFHIHQVHFLSYAENGIRPEHPEWLDTVNVPVKGSVDLMMDFTDPIIRGTSLFHCHLLSHEDKGMMAKLLFK
jgi:FtsP/CotA-like multicopper oxidase with cupredoxin domain